jgi:hypothetical protein
MQTMPISLQGSLANRKVLALRPASVIIHPCCCRSPWAMRRIIAGSDSALARYDGDQRADFLSSCPITRPGASGCDLLSYLNYATKNHNRFTDIFLFQISFRPYEN